MFNANGSDSSRNNINTATRILNAIPTRKVKTTQYSFQAFESVRVKIASTQNLNKKQIEFKFCKLVLQLVSISSFCILYNTFVITYCYKREHCVIFVLPKYVVYLKKKTKQISVLLKNNTVNISAQNKP